MRKTAILIVLTMLTTGLAGCTSDPDGGGNDGIDSDALDDLFDEYFQDFVNNTSITVINHYHNNTTYVVDDGDYSTTIVNEYNNTTINEGDETSTNNYNNQTENDYSSLNYSFGGASFGTGANGSVSGSSMMFVAHVTFTAMDLFPDYEITDYRNNTFVYDYTYYDYLTNSYRNDTFSFSCQVFYLVGSMSNGSSVSYWENNNYYQDAWQDQYNSTIADMLQSAAWNSGVRSTCDEDYAATMPIKDGTDGWGYTFLSIDIPQGYAIQYLQLDSMHLWYGCNDDLQDYDCRHSEEHRNHGLTQFYTYSGGPSPYHAYQYYYGGWSNLSIDFELRFHVDSYGEGHGSYSVWPTSEYEFTLYYQFVPVIPVE